MGSLGSSLASSLGKTAVGFGTQALLSSFGIEEEDDEGDGITDALVAGFSNLTAGGDEGGGEPAPAPAPGTMEFMAVSDPSAYGQGVPAPPPQPVSAVSMTGGEFQTAYSAGPQYTSYSVELPSLEFNYSSGGNNASNPNGNNSWNPMANQQIAINNGGNVYSSHTGIPNGARQPQQPQQSLHPVYHHPQSANWNPYH